MSKEIRSHEDAQKKLYAGVAAVAQAVAVTIGPRGRNVIYDKGYGVPMITNDGVSIAKEISLTDKFENMGAELIKEVANKTNELAGDGTTTSIVLTHAIVEEGMRRVGMGANGLMVRHGIEAATKDIVSALKAMAHPIKSKTEIEQVATISAESAPLGKIIAETIETVGKDGVVTVEESQSFGVMNEVVEGLEFDKGYISPYMITQQERMEAILAQAPVLVTDHTIASIKDILPLLEKLAASGKKELAIIAEDINGEALTTLVVNKLRGAFTVVGIKAPGFGDQKKAQLEDIAIVTGATLVTADTGMTLDAIDTSMLGKAEKIIATKDKTVIVGGKGKKESIKQRIEELKAVRNSIDSKFAKFDIEKIDKRIAKLSGGVAVIKVGAATEAEMKYLKLKVEDAVHATRAAIAEGIVPGGGVALIKAAKQVGDTFMASKLYKQAHESKRSSEYVIGYLALLKAVKAPLTHIAHNAGREDAAVIIDMIEKTDGHMGYDAGADTGETVTLIDFFKAGIIDPVKVTRTALENAASTAGILLTTAVAIAEAPKPEGDKTPVEGVY